MSPRAASFQVVVTQRPDEVLAAERVVLPGQGAMRDCMRELQDSGLQGGRARRGRGASR